VSPPSLLAQLPDAALIRRFLDGDEAAFRALYQRHTPRLRMIVQRLLGPRRDEADDVVQETWLAGCRGLHRYQGEAQFSSWLTTIGVRAAYARFDAHRELESELFDDAAFAPPDGSATVIDLERALARLPHHQRAVVVLHDVEGYTHEEIAAQLGVAPGTSKATLSRARQTLRRLLTEGVPNAS
jgi:RNA polymerase sigma factor (sigma-70 family)